MCEIEHFVDPNDKKHSKFSKVSDHKLNLLSACNQLAGKSAEMLSIGKAVKEVCKIFFKIKIKITAKIFIYF